MRQYIAGQLWAGKYRLDHVLGEGGMGVVVAATHVALGRRVAIKFLRAEVAGNRELVERMMREARASALLQSEHVARILDVGVEDGAPYLVLELLVGEDLAAVLTQGPLAPPVAVDYILQAAEALAEAHAARIVHRDLKPQNLFLTQRASDGAPLVKVLDFGISKVDLGGTSVLTATGAVIGTPAYMPPEQLRSTRSVDPRGDIWSLGICLYELISGRRPFHGESFSEVCLKIGIDAVSPLTSPHLFDLTGLGAVVQRCLQKDPAHRYQSIVELAAALAPFAGETGWTRYQHCLRFSAGPSASATILAPRTALPSLSTTGHSAGQVATSPIRGARNRWIIGLSAIGLIAVAFAAAGLLAGVGRNARSGGSFELPRAPLPTPGADALWAAPERGDGTPDASPPRARARGDAGPVAVDAAIATAPDAAIDAAPDAAIDARAAPAPRAAVRRKPARKSVKKTSAEEDLFNSQE